MDINTKKTQIEQTLDTAGWQHIEKLIDEHIDMLRDPSRISGNLRNDIYAREVRAGVMAAKYLESLLKKIKVLGITNNNNSNKDYD